ncbi:MAG: hypothetical protein JWO38_411 [Gemmataceae bacterium]|nr:hypothetical protein [Gemmataceae bacterium]
MADRYDPPAEVPLTELMRLSVPRPTPSPVGFHPADVYGLYT